MKDILAHPLEGVFSLWVHFLTDANIGGSTKQSVHMYLQHKLIDCPFGCRCGTINTYSDRRTDRY